MSEDLGQVRSNQRGLARNELMNRVGYDLNFDVFEFVLLNNQLINKGFVITDENREDKYLEIINLDDDELIETLRNFLEAFDRLSPHLFFYRKYKEVSKLIDELQDKDSIVKAVEEYLKIYH